MGFWNPNSNTVPLTCMFYRAGTNGTVNHFHERLLKLANGKYELTYEEHWEKDSWFTVDHWNNQILCSELSKVYHNLYETIVSHFFTRNNNIYNLRLKTYFVISQVRTILKGSTPSGIMVL